MFVPRYTITNALLSRIKQINTQILELNQKRFPTPILVKLEKTAKEVSSFASTSIEGNPLSLTSVKNLLKTKPSFIRDSQKEVLNYNNALSYVNKKVKVTQQGLSLKTILAIHKKVVKGLLPLQQSGFLRQHPVVINDPATRKTVFLPPNHQDIEKLMGELVQFVKKNKDMIDPLIIAGIFHKQMVIIHPFMDGNGRTSRLATTLLLAELGLDTLSLFSFEQYYNRNVSKYFTHVGEYGDYYELASEINFTKWLEYFAEGIIDELERVEKLLPMVGTSPETTLAKHHQVIIQYITDNNFISDKDYARLIDRARATRALDFKKLIKLELIERKGKGKGTYYVLK